MLVGWKRLEAGDLKFPGHLEYVEPEVGNSLMMPMHRQLTLHQVLLAQRLFLCVVLFLPEANLA